MHDINEKLLTGTESIDTKILPQKVIEQYQSEGFIFAKIKPSRNGKIILSFTDIEIVP